LKATKQLNPMLFCPDCLSDKIKKNGHTHYGKQNHKCKSCGRQFVLNNQHTIDEQLREMARRALLERVSLTSLALLKKTYPATEFYGVRG
jgi:transposase-like protein